MAIVESSGLIPTFLPNEHGTFHRDAAPVMLTAAGRIRYPAIETGRQQRGAVAQAAAATQLDAGSPKPGATVLAQMTAGRTLPLLVTQSYGHGRTAVLATSGTWRWREWRRSSMARRFLLAATAAVAGEGLAGQVTATMPERTLMDDRHVHVTAVARDKDFQPAADAKVQAHLIGPDGAAEFVEMAPVPNQPGTFANGLDGGEAGGYVAEVERRGKRAKRK